jgi:hypothetical protein
MVHRMYVYAGALEMIDGNGGSDTHKDVIQYCSLSRTGRFGRRSMILHQVLSCCYVFCAWSLYEQRANGDGDVATFLDRRCAM